MGLLPTDDRGIEGGELVDLVIRNVVARHAGDQGVVLAAFDVRLRLGGMRAGEQSEACKQDGKWTQSHCSYIPACGRTSIVGFGS